MKRSETEISFSFTADNDGNVGKISGMSYPGDAPNISQLLLKSYEWHSDKKVNFVFSKKVLDKHIEYAIKEMTK